MKLHIMGSSSAGNGYILEGETSALVVEAGVPLRDIKKALNFNIAKVEGLVISHCHNDHAGRANEYAAAGLQVFSNLDTLKCLNQRYSYRYNHVRATKKYHIKEFSILPFDVVHDVTTYGYLIQHQEMGLTCFITDSMYSPAVFPGLNNILIEANYDENILFDNVMSGRVNATLADRIRTSHMSFQTAMEFLNNNDLSAVNNIVLLHLSNQNSNEDDMVAQLQNTMCQSIHAAKAGTVINLDKYTF